MKKRCVHHVMQLFGETGTVPLHSPERSTASESNQPKKDPVRPRGNGSKRTARFEKTRLSSSDRLLFVEVESRALTRVLQMQALSTWACLGTLLGPTYLLGGSGARSTCRRVGRKIELGRIPLGAFKQRGSPGTPEILIQNESRLSPAFPPASTLKLTLTENRSASYGTSSEFGAHGRRRRHGQRQRTLDTGLRT